MNGGVTTGDGLCGDGAALRGLDDGGIMFVEVLDQGGPVVKGLDNGIMHVDMRNRSTCLK